NGVPIDEYDIVPLTVGTDLYVVVDANSRIQEADDESGTTRLQKVKDSILIYGGRFMDLAQRDHVTVIVPGGDGVRVLVDEATAPATLIDAVRSYDPGRLPQSAALGLLEAALDRARAVGDGGRFQAIVLYTDAAGLNEALFPPLIARAQAQQVPIFVLLIGGGETPNENAVAIATALTTPTRGFQVPMPSASDSSEVFQVIADNGVQSQLRYRSNIMRSGEYTVTVTQERQRDEATLDLQLAPPEVALQVPQVTIQRAGTQPDSPLEELQPTVQPLLAQVSWPDGLPRRIVGASLLANGQVQDAPFVGVPDANGGADLQFDWRVADLEAGRYELTVVVTDTLGLAARSEGELVSIALLRPDPVPSPSPTSTPQPLQTLRQLLPPTPSRAELAPYLPPLGGALLVLVLGIFLGNRLRRRRKRADALEPPPEAGFEALADQTAAPGWRAFLEPLSPGGKALLLPGDNVIIGSEESQVQLCLDDASISKLHGRIRCRDGHYWLYDEGSQQGTFLNHARLGLAPKLLHNGDEIQLGRVRLRFRLEKEENAAPAHIGGQEEAEQAASS
ncbi:MAG TPA: FHA domain-containing protein, partial [Candidatus Binatia bacterium]|nr:FHA domain-containing protein [Candidatus Binatia bacterium]